MKNKTYNNIKPLDLDYLNVEEIEILLCLLYHKENKKYNLTYYLTTQKAIKLYEDIILYRKAKEKNQNYKLDITIPDKLEKYYHKYTTEDVMNYIFSLGKKTQLILEDIERKPILKIKKLKIYSKTFNGIVGYNGVGKTTFAIYLAHLLSQKYNVLYFFLEDRIIYDKLKKSIKKKIEFIFTFDFETIINYTRKVDVDIVFIDTLATVKDKNTKSYFDKEELVKTLYGLSFDKTIFLLNHILKTKKMEKATPSIYYSYTAGFANYLDLGIVIDRENDRMKLKVEKNRFGPEQIEFNISMLKLRNLLQKENTNDWQKSKKIQK